MKIELEVDSITVVVSHGTDTVLINTNLPQGVWPFGKTGGHMSLEVARGRGAQYVRDNFGIEPKVIKTH
jgi:hypothetical protein